LNSKSILSSRKGLPKETEQLLVANKIIEQYGRYRLLTFDHDPTTREPTIEVAHEALLREWPRLRGWLDQSRDDVRMQRMLAAATNEWQESNQDSGFLLRDTRLDQFAIWIDGTDLALTANEQAYLSASLAERKARQDAEAERQEREQALEQRSRLVLRVLVAIFALAAVIALALSGVAYIQRENARESDHIARAGELGAVTRTLTEQQPDLAALLAVEAYRQSGTLQNWTTLYEVGTYNSQLNRVMRGHAGRIESIAFSSDGKALASGGVDGTVRWWDMDPDSPAYGSFFELPHEMDSPVFECVAFSPDERLLAASTKDGHVLLWDIDRTSPTFKHLLKSRVAEEMIRGGRSWLAFHPRAQILATVPKNGQIELLNTNPDSAKFGELLDRFPSDKLFSHLAFSPDGQSLAAAEWNYYYGGVHIWEVDIDNLRLGQKIATFRPETKFIGTMAFNPDGKQLAIGLFDHNVELWDIQQGSPGYGQKVKTLTGHEYDLFGIAYSPDGKQLASVAGRDKQALLWDVDPESPSFGEQVGLPLTHTSFVDSVSFSPEGDILAIGAADGIYLWNMDLEALPVNRRGPPAEGWPINPPASPEIQFPHPLETVLQGHRGMIEGLDFSPDGKILASGSGDIWGGDDWDFLGTIRLWDVDPTSATFGQQLGGPFRGHSSPITDIAYDPGGKRLASSSWDGDIRLWDIDQRSPTFGQTLGKPMSRHIADALEVEFSPNGQVLASTDFYGEICFWDVDPASPNFTRRLIKTPINGHGDVTDGLAYSPDGAFLATGSQSWNWGMFHYTPIRLWDANPASSNFGNLVQELKGGHTGGIKRLEFYPYGKILASGSEDGTIRLWDVDPDSPNFGEVIGLPLIVGQTVFGLAFSPDGKYLAGNSIDVGKIYLWEVDPSTANVVQVPGITLNQEGIYALSLAFSPDGKYLAIGDIDYRIHLWNIDPEAWIEHSCLRAGRNLTQSEWNQYLDWVGPYDPDYKTCPMWP
jgi:WD40 repeat protein